MEERRGARKRPRRPSALREQLDAFGKRLRFLRGLEQLTQAELAELAQLSVEHISKLERGLGGPSFAGICALASALGTEPASLFLFSCPGRGEITDAASGLDWARHMPRMGYWDRELRSDNYFASDGMRRILGHKPKAAAMTLGDFLNDHVHPQDRRLLVQAKERHDSGRDGSRLLFRFRRKGDEQYRMAMAEFELKRNPEGRASRVVGSVLDLTEMERLACYMQDSRGDLEERIRERTSHLNEIIRVLGREMRERMLAQDRLDLFSFILSVSRDMIALIGPDHRYRMVSQGYVDIYGRTREQMIGKTPGDLMGVDAYQGGLRACLDRCLAGEEVGLCLGLDSPIMGPRRFEVSYFPYREGGGMRRGPVKGVVAVAHDVTDAQRAWDLVEKVPSMVYRMRLPDGVYEFVNEACRGLIGHSPQALHASPRLFLECVHPDFRKAYRRWWAGLFCGTSKPLFDHRIVDADGREKWVRHCVTLIHGEDGEAVAVEGAVFDITDVKTLEAKLMADRDRAEQAGRNKSTFLASMSHDIRTHLNGITGMLQIMHRLAREPETYRCLDNAMEASRRLVRLLEDILDLSRVESGRLSLAREPFALAGVFSSLEALFAATARAKGIELSLEIDERLPALLVGDAMRLSQVLFNLVDNAVKYTDQGRVAVSAFPLPESDTQRIRVLFSVEDTGAGIPDHMADRIMEPFIQAGSGAGSRGCVKGCGLGLSIVKQMVRLMGGHMSMASEEGRGTHARVALPFHTALEEPGGVRPEPLPERVSCRILLVEDDPLSSLGGKMLLEMLGCRVECVADGKQALEVLGRQDFDLVIMDVNLPEMSGVEATRIIRTAPEFREKSEIPIVAFTADAMAGDEDRFLEAGMNAYLAKPLEERDLLRVLTELLGSKG